jgi:hypothetical protein
VTANDNFVPPDLDAAIAALPVEALRLAKRRFSDAALRQVALDERDACYRTLAVGLAPARSGYAMALAIQTALARYRDRGPWRFERGRKAPVDPPRALMHRIRSITASSAPSARSSGRSRAVVQNLPDE